MLFDAVQPLSAETFLAPIINTFSATSGHSALVLDDYHLLKSEAIHQGLSVLLEHLPPTLHLVVASRAEPPLPFRPVAGERASFGSGTRRPTV